MERVWIIYAEVGPHGDHPNGAFVECYVPACDIANAIRAAGNHLVEQGRTVVDITRAILFSSDEWDDNNDSNGEVRNAAAIASTTSRVQRGVFRTWEDEE